MTKCMSTAAVLLAAMTAGAHASSFETIGETAPTETPSIEVVGSSSSIEVVGATAVEGSSFLVLGDPAPDDIKVASTTPDAQPAKETLAPLRLRDLPKVMRAGIFGDAFARSITPQPAEAAATDETATASGGTSSAGTAKGDASTADESQQKQTGPSLKLR